MAQIPSCSNSLNPIDNTAYISYQYSVDPNQSNIVVSGVTNQVVTDLVCVYTEKSSNKAVVNMGDTIIYTVNIVNNSTISVNNLIFFDTVPSGTSFVPNTFNVSSYGYVYGANPNYGVDLSTIVGTLAPQGSCSLSFNVIFNFIP